MQCEKCKQPMEKKKTYESGNSTFQQWQCAHCWQEKSEAVGIVDGSEPTTD